MEEEVPRQAVRRLRQDLGAQHGPAVPCRGAVDLNLDTLLLGGRWIDANSDTQCAADRWNRGKHTGRVLECATKR